MRLNKIKLIIPLVVLGLLVTAYFLLSGKNETADAITVEARKGAFEVLVYTSGQLEAENSEKIIVPEELSGRNVRIYEIKITDIIEEGTQVQKGDYVASLDHKVVEEELTRAREDLLQAVNDFEDAKMDSNLNLSNNRDQIINGHL
jgi:multidrug efflux pump subunit AcrA (membrane-fusion protein)